MSPQRVQMSRQRPWRAEYPGAVIVDRRTRWGNPFRVGDRVRYQDSTGARHEQLVDSAERAVRFFRSWMAWEIDLPGVERPSLTSAGLQLRGRDLACWCPLEQPCHADVLLELASADGGKS